MADTSLPSSDVFRNISVYSAGLRDVRENLGLLSQEAVAALVLKTPLEGLPVVVLHLWERACVRKVQTDHLLKLSARTLERAKAEYDALQSAYEQACSERDTNCIARDANFREAELLRVECDRLRAQNNQYESSLRGLVDQLKAINGIIIPALPQQRKENI